MTVVLVAGSYVSLALLRTMCCNSNDLTVIAH